MTTLIQAVDGRFHCPYCAYDTQLVNSMAAHLRKKHGQWWVITPILVLPEPEETAVDPPADEPEEDKE